MNEQLPFLGSRKYGRWLRLTLLALNIKYKALEMQAKAAALDENQPMT